MKTNQALSNECLTLACFCSYTYDGSSVISGAFDTYSEDLHPLGTPKHYNFSIDIKVETLTLTVDAYIVANEFTEFTSETWDHDAWVDQMIVVEGVPANRANFYSLAQCARALINGRSVSFSDGTVIPAIVRVAA